MTSRAGRGGSLAVRLTALATGATAAVLLVVLLGAFTVFNHQVNRSVDASLRLRLGDLQAAISQSGPSAVQQEPLAQVYASDGAVIAASGTVPDGERLLPESLPVECPGPDLLVGRTVRLATGGGAEPLRVRARCLAEGDVLAVAVSVEQQRDARRRLLLLLLVVAPLLLAGVAVTVWRAVRAALRPVDELTRQAQRISAGDDVALRMPLSRRSDEITRLGQTLQEMLARLSVAFSREQAFVDDAAHELRTPLAVLRGEIELALSDLADPAGVETSLRAALGEAERLGRLAEDLLALARQRAAGAQPQHAMELEPLLAEVVRRAALVFPLTVEVADTGGLSVGADPDRLERIVMNLLANAAAAGAGTVAISAARMPRAPGSSTPADVSLVVEDDGPGFAADFLPTAFERFSRADEARTRSSGAGLGLALVHALVAGLGGSVTADNASALGGAAVRLTLPSDGH